MKHSNDDGGLQTNLLQAFQKNKLIQGKLNEQHRSYYVQLIKEMQEYNLKEKLNKELLYTWKKENYVRQLKKKLQEYERKRFGVRDAYYDYQVRNLECVITGQQGLAIPPQEEERRISVNAKYHQFLQEHPVRIRTPMRGTQSANAVIDPIKQKNEEEDAHAVEETWKHIHAQSAVGLKRKKRKLFLPTIQRSLTLDEISRTKLVQATAPIVPNVPSTTTIPEIINASSSDYKRQATLGVPPLRSTFAEDMEPIKITSEILEKQTRGDLVAMRSVRRPQKNPIDLNITFESRKRIYQINKRVYDYQLCRRKCGLQYDSQFERTQQIDPADDDDNLLVEMSDTTRRRYEDRHQADKNFI